MSPILSNKDNRVRANRHTAPNSPHGSLKFINPFPWMSATEAMVYIALEAHTVPFSWRFFDGYSPTYQQLLGNQGYQPEFTLLEYNTVILVIGGFFGTLPGAVDKVSLAQVALEADGWRVVVLFEQEILHIGAWTLLVPAIPGLGSITGAPRANPYGHPDLLTSLRKHHFRRLNPKLKKVHFRETVITGEKHVRRDVGRAGSRNTDSGRTRSERTGAVPGRRTPR